MASSIIIQTRRARQILTAQYPDEPPLKVAAYERKFSRMYPDNTLRRRATAAYNCYGLVFACRRAWVMIESVKDILSDDGYRQLRTGEQPLPGDVLIYVEDGLPEHVAVIVELFSIGQTVIPKVISKWAAGPEYVHMATRSPFGTNYTCWTERP